MPSQQTMRGMEGTEDPLGETAQFVHMGSSTELGVLTAATWALRCHSEARATEHSTHNMVSCFSQTRAVVMLRFAAVRDGDASGNGNGWVPNGRRSIRGTQEAADSSLFRRSG